jgi:hypothetical protein
MPFCLKLLLAAESTTFTGSLPLAAKDKRAVDHGLGVLAILTFNFSGGVIGEIIAECHWKSDL